MSDRDRSDVARADARRRPVLEDHTSVKRKLVPPMMSAFGGKLFAYSWTRQIVPDAIWIALVIDMWGYEPACKLCRSFIKTTLDVLGGEAAPSLQTLSSFSALTEAQRVAILDAIDPSVRARIATALAALTVMIADHPLAFLAEGGPSADAGTRLQDVLRECYDRNSRLAVLTMAAAYYLAIEQGKLHIARHLVGDLIEKFKIIGDYPDTEASQRAAGAFRAAAPMLFMSKGEDKPGFEAEGPWTQEFWNAVSGFGPCQFPDTLVDEVPTTDDPFEIFIVDFRNAVRSDLRARLSKWPLDLHVVEVYEVISALLCRQATLALELASSPAIWTPHTAPIVLRAMADVFITMAWILEDPEPRSRRFVEDGLGAIKLQIAHRERALEQATDPDERAEIVHMLDVWRDWLAAQRMDQFVEVNLGSWSGLNTRKMAEEAGDLDFYNYVYQPFSGAAHSNWAHVSFFNAVHCENPAHRLHRSPAIIPTAPDPNWLRLAAKYLSKAFFRFDEKNGLFEMPDDAFELVCERVVWAPDVDDEAPTG